MLVPLRFCTLQDVASRKHTTNLTDFLHTFSIKFQLPQNNYWHLFHFNTRLNTRICAELLTTTSTMESWNRLSKKGHAFLAISNYGSLAITQGLYLASNTSHATYKSRYWVPTQSILDIGISNRKHKVRAQTVAVALRAISTTMQLEEQLSPVVDAQGHYPKAISQLLEGYKRQDPPAEPKLVIPVIVPNHLVQHNRSTQLQRAVGNLALTAFNFLLRVSEYTYHKQSD